MSFKVEVISDDTGKYLANELRFETRTQAEDYAMDLSWRWTAVREWRVAESDDPVTEKVA